MHAGKNGVKILAGLLICVPGFVQATDLTATRKLHDEKCVACHAQKSAFGDPDAIYRRSDSTVKSYQRLKTMVSLCNSELRLDLFPEDEQDLVVFLNETYYRLKK